MQKGQQNKIVRYHILDRCFRDLSRTYTTQDLYEICKEAMQRIDSKLTYGMRMFYCDIQQMKKLPPVGYGIEFQKVKWRNKIWRYKDPNFSISQGLPSKIELEELKRALNTLSRFGIDVEKELVPKIEKFMNNRIQKQIYAS